MENLGNNLMEEVPIFKPFTGTNITINVPNVITKVTGFLLCFIDEKGAWTSMPHEEKIGSCLKDALWPITITMPCGETATFKSLLEFPQKTLMCPCGDKDHVVVDINF